MLHWNTEALAAVFPGITCWILSPIVCNFNWAKTNTQGLPETVGQWRHGTKWQQALPFYSPEWQSNWEVWAELAAFPGACLILFLVKPSRAGRGLRHVCGDESSWIVSGPFFSCILAAGAAPVRTLHWFHNTISFDNIFIRQPSVSAGGAFVLFVHVGKACSGTKWLSCDTAALSWNVPSGAAVYLPSQLLSFISWFFLFSVCNQALQQPWRTPICLKCVGIYF